MARENETTMAANMTMKLRRSPNSRMVMMYCRPMTLFMATVRLSRWIKQKMMKRAKKMFAARNDRSNLTR